VVEQQDNVDLIFFGLRALTFIEESFSRKSRAAERFRYFRLDWRKQNLV